MSVRFNQPRQKGGVGVVYFDGLRRNGNLLNRANGCDLISADDNSPIGV